MSPEQASLSKNHRNAMDYKEVRQAESCCGDFDVKETKRPEES